jgi:hypothetical protein
MFFLSRLSALSVTLVAIFGFLAISAQAQTPTLGPDVSSRTVSLFDSLGHGPKAADQFSASASLEGFGFCPADRCLGREAIRQALKMAADDKVAFMTMAPVRVANGSSATGQVHVLSDSIRRGGAQRLVYNFEIQFEGQLVSRLKLVPLLSDSQTSAFLGTGKPASVPPRLVPPAAGDGGLR